MKKESFTLSYVKDDIMGIDISNMSAFDFTSVVCQMMRRFVIDYGLDPKIVAKLLEESILDDSNDVEETEEN